MKELSSPELPQFHEKLVTAVMIDFPEVREVLVSFPDEWEIVRSFRWQDLPVYAAALPWEEEKPRRDQFYGLSAEINLTLKKYRHLKLFEPWPQPVIPIVWDVEKGEGRVARGGHIDVRLQPIAEAQVWAGDTFGLIWECYPTQSRRKEDWQEELATFWRAVEADMRVTKLFTQPHDSAVPQGYTDFLHTLGYQPDPDFRLWWSKEL
jgi:hypothetical protein